MKESKARLKEVSEVSREEASDLPELPKTWLWVKFGAVCEKIFDGTHFSPVNLPSGEFKYVTAKNIKEHGIDLRDISYVTEEAHRAIYARCDVRKGDVLYIKDGATTGIATVNNLDEEFSLLSSVGVFRSNPLHVDSKYMAYYLNSKVTRNRMLSHIAGVAITRLTLIKLNNSLLALPPLPEQQAIVSKLEQLFSELDKGIESLKTAQQQLKVYRQSVLKWAFEGLEETVAVEALADSSQIGLVRSNADQNREGYGVPYVKMNNIDLNGNIDLADLVFVEANRDETERFSLKKGDLLINTRNSFELVGKTGIYRGEAKTIIFNNNILRLRVRAEYDPFFIGYQMISPWVRGQMLKEKKATTNVCALYQRDILPIRIKVTEKARQTAIAADIESRLSVCDDLEKTIAASLNQAEALRQSILKKAFEGKLLSDAELEAVRKDPAWEPAEKLLERIREERAKAEGGGEIEKRSRRAGEEYSAARRKVK
jgi:restriction endonuclease S subunit